MRARIELTGCITHTGRNRKITRGEAFYTTDVSDIRYYRSLADFQVVIVEGDAPPPAKPKLMPRAPAVATEDHVDELDESEATAEDSDMPEDNEGTEDDVPEDDAMEPDMPVVYNRSQLEAVKKSELANIAKQDFGIDIDPDQMQKRDMVAAILRAQIDKLKEQTGSVE